MSNQDVFSKINTTMDLASNTNSNGLSGLIILSAIYTEFCVADLICAEADKVDYAIDSTATVGDLVNLDNSVAGVLDQLCCIERQVNEKIAQGIQLRS
ncbi:hypothetical protein ACLIBG_14495 [Virgibacillus sp. W0181]|uniref:hypothetical protein n=1 Tax=Virgibacillus sp. W0181 TaxID=3391581 RepID=UPI003F45A72C